MTLTNINNKIYLLIFVPFGLLLNLLTVSVYSCACRCTQVHDDQRTVTGVVPRGLILSVPTPLFFFGGWTFLS